MRTFVEENFSLIYTHFKEFQFNKEFLPYWDKCIEALCDNQLLSHIVFCNDIFCIPPVKTFLTYYKNDFIALTGKDNAELPVFVKKSIGAFWGMVFKFALGYKGQKNVSVSMNEFFKVRTATYFIKSEG
jgi:hypothetical protein